MNNNRKREIRDYLLKTVKRGTAIHNQTLIANSNYEFWELISVWRDLILERKVEVGQVDWKGVFPGNSRYANKHLCSNPRCWYRGSPHDWIFYEDGRMEVICFICGTVNKF